MSIPLLPFCRKAIDAARLSELGLSMSRRRGVNWSPA